MSRELEKADIERAAEALCGWLLEQFAGDRYQSTHDDLCELHPDTWAEVAEVAIRAGRGEVDCRPFTMLPGLPR